MLASAKVNTHPPRCPPLAAALGVVTLLATYPEHAGRFVDQLTALLHVVQAMSFPVCQPSRVSGVIW